MFQMQRQQTLDMKCGEAARTEESFASDSEALSKIIVRHLHFFHSVLVAVDCDSLSTSDAKSIILNAAAYSIWSPYYDPLGSVSSPVKLNGLCAR
jgi:hypothetical protein